MLDKQAKLKPMEKDPRPFWQWAVLFILIASAITYIGASWYFSDILINFNTKTLEQDRQDQGISSPADYGFANAQALSIPANKVSLDAWYVPNSNPCGVILLHGRTNTRYGTLAYAPMFIQRGCHVLSYDARRHGESSQRLGTYGYHESRDLTAVLEYFKTLTGLSNSQIGFLGESYGASTAILAAQSHSDLAFVIADSSFEDLQSIVSEQAVAQYGEVILPLLPGAFMISELRARFEADDVSPKNAVIATRVPLLLQHAKEDAYTLAKHSENIFANADKSQTMLYISDWGAAHAGAIRANPTGYAAVVDEFLSAFASQFPARQ